MMHGNVMRTRDKAGRLTSDPASVAPRLIEYSSVVDGCWVWTGSKNSKGYGRLSVNGKRKFAHRTAYRLWVKPIPDGLTLDHLCRNPACIKPTHLEPVTFRENVLRGVGPTAINSRKERCPNGHTLAGANLVKKKGSGRECKTCHNHREKLRKRVMRGSPR